jgi:hypothetical protein
VSIAIGLKQLKLAASWLSGAAKVAGYAPVAGAIDLALKSADLAEVIRPGQDDAIAQALHQVLAEVDAGTRHAFTAEFGADWERRTDLAAMFEALPIVLDRFVPDTDAIFDANLDPARIGQQVAEAADNAREDLFRKGTPRERMLRAVVTQAYVAALRNKDFVLRLQVRMQQEMLDRQDQQTAKLDAILATLHADKSVPLPTLRRILKGFGERDVMLDLAAIEARLTAKAEEYRALRERLDRLGNNDPRVQALRHEAGAQIDAGDFAVADAKLSEAEQIDLAAVEEIEALARSRG